MITIQDYSNEELDDLSSEDLKTEIWGQVEERLNAFIEMQDEQVVSNYFKRLILFLLDTSWQEHMVILDDLKQGINLKAYAQVDPLIAFQMESFDLFEDMMNYINEETLRMFYRLQTNVLMQK